MVYKLLGIWGWSALQSEGMDYLNEVIGIVFVVFDVESKKVKERNPEYNDDSFSTTLREKKESET